MPKFRSSVHQIDAKGHLRHAGKPLAAGALVAHPQQIAEEHKDRRAHQGDVGTVIVVKGLGQRPALLGQPGGAPHGDRRPCDPQQVDEVLRRAAQCVLL